MDDNPLMTKRFYRILYFTVFFSFSLVDSLAQRISPVPEKANDSAQEIKAIDVLSSTQIHTSTRTSATGVSATITDATCYGSTSGKIVYTISGGTPPYRYQWSNGTTNTVYGNCWYTILVNNPGTVALTDYQVMVTIPYASATSMNADFSNVSFSDTTNTVQYAFWKESALNNEGVFWVKVPSFPPGDSYMRVSFCSATPAPSNGLATFEYFDDFNDQDITDWILTCNDINFPDEICNAGVQQVAGTNYSAILKSYSHCVGTAPTVGVNNKISKNITLVNGQYWIDVSSKFLVCLRTICSDSSRIYSRIYLNNIFYSAFFLEKRTTCGCAASSWTQIRANGPMTYSGAPITYDLRTELTDCAEGEIQYDNFRIRKWYVDPDITIDVPKTLTLNNLTAGDYTLTVTDGTGAVTTETYTVNGLAEPEVNDYTTCGKSPATLVSSGPYATFEWYDVLTGGVSLYTGVTYKTDSLDHDKVFYVAGVGPGGCQTSPRTPAKISILVPGTSNDCLTIYTGISPNGDGLNEVWEIKGIESYPNNKVQIFDRWGNIVFEKNSYNNKLENAWKGNSNRGLSKGQDLPDGTYYYEINIDGLEKPLSGFVIINRQR